MFSLLTCPYCWDRNIELKVSEEESACPHCERKYPILNGIPCFLPYIPNNKETNTNLNSWKEPWFSKLANLLNKKDINKERYTLDIGCGNNPRGLINMDIYLPDPLPQNFILASADLLPFKKNSVESIASFYNVEHLTEPAYFIRKIVNIAQKKVYIATDNCEYIGDYYFRICGTGRLFNDEHCYSWNVNYLEQLIRRLGFKEARVYLTNLSPNTLVKLLSYLGKIPRIGNFFYRDIVVELTKQ